MGVRSTLTTWAGSTAMSKAAPAVAARGARQFVDIAIDGFRGFPGAREVARRHLERRRDVDRAIKDVIEQHIRLAGVQGFVTNIGGIVTMPVAIPANIAGLAVVELRMVAAIAHLRGYDLAEPRVRAAALLTLLGKDGVQSASKSRHIPGSPHDVATGVGRFDPAELERMAANVIQDMVKRVGGKHASLTIARRVPMLGGAVSAGVDAVAAHAIGRFADREFPPHVMIERT